MVSLPDLSFDVRKLARRQRPLVKTVGLTTGGAYPACTYLNQTIPSTMASPVGGFQRGGAALLRASSPAASVLASSRYRARSAAACEAKPDATGTQSHFGRPD